MATSFVSSNLVLAQSSWSVAGVAFGVLIVAGVAVLVAAWLCVRYIPNNTVGVVEKLWSADGSVPEGQIIALDDEAGFQAELLRGGLHFGYWRWQYRVHRAPLVTISQGKIGYVYARDGQALLPSQTLGREVECNSFQDARSFLAAQPGSQAGDSLPLGQRGRQRAILREGVYAINPALFVAITEEKVYALPAIQNHQEIQTLRQFLEELSTIDGFSPIVIGAAMKSEQSPEPDQALHVDSIGIVTVHDGNSLPPDEIIAPIVGSEPGSPGFHNNFQDAEAFLQAGGSRGRQYQTLIDGTYFINRWFATVEMIPKTVVPIGYVGVVVSYIGRHGDDLSGKNFRHGEQVATGEKGVWEKSFGPGKYAFNRYAGSIILVPTTNFVLHWITGRSESHKYDESLRSIDLVTKDAYEPLLPLSVVVHIDYERAPSVIQRFGDVKKLITQTIDPMLSAFFRDVAHKKTMLELLHDRDKIQQEARVELRDKFRAFDIECVDVLIGKPSNAPNDDKIETLLEQLRQRQLSCEQLETFERRKTAAEKLQELKAAEAQAEMQTSLTNAKVQAQIAEAQGEAELARARKQAQQTVVIADAALERSRREAEQKVLLAEADSQERVLAGRGESQKIMQIGLSEATVLTRKIRSFGDPRLFALQEVADKFSTSQQPLVPERLFVSGSPSGDESPLGSGMLGMLLQLLVAEKSGVHPLESTESSPVSDLADRMSEKALASMIETFESQVKS
ncbi:MAG: SPFH domain-containing protein [Pirellulaceae bacterium]|nr:SPFH domain-containing protein [Pirellulaceae bacterium]